MKPKKRIINRSQVRRGERSLGVWERLWTPLCPRKGLVTDAKPERCKKA